jgi:hypothetical protein
LALQRCKIIPATQGKTLSKGNTMTITDRPDAELLTWSAPADGLWVASTPSAYLGMVDRSGDGFVATDSCGREVGVFGSVQEARVAVYEAWTTNPPVPAELRAAEPCRGELCTAA